VHAVPRGLSPPARFFFLSAHSVPLAAFNPDAPRRRSTPPDAPLDSAPPSPPRGTHRPRPSALSAELAEITNAERLNAEARAARRAKRLEEDHARAAREAIREAERAKRAAEEDAARRRRDDARARDDAAFFGGLTGVVDALRDEVRGNANASGPGEAYRGVDGVEALVSEAWDLSVEAFREELRRRKISHDALTRLTGAIEVRTACTFVFRPPAARFRRSIARVSPFRLTDDARAHARNGPQESAYRHFVAAGMKRYQLNHENQTDSDDDDDDDDDDEAAAAGLGENATGENDDAASVASRGSGRSVASSVRARRRMADVRAERKVRSIHWSPYDRVGVVNADP